MESNLFPDVRSKQNIDTQMNQLKRQLDMSPLLSANDEGKLIEKEVVDLRKEIKDVEEEKMLKQKKLPILQVECQKNEEECKTLQKQFKQLKKDVEKLRRDRAELVGDPLTKSDCEKLNKCKRKLWLYEECTGVIFDYTVVDSIDGFVMNSKKDYFRTFSFKKNEFLQDTLWNEVKKAGSLQCPKHPQ